MSRTRVIALLVSAVVSATAGCASADRDVLGALDALPATASTEAVASPQPAPPTTMPKRQRRCEDQSLATASFEPAVSYDSDATSFVQELRNEGRIVVGVDENTDGFSARNLRTGEIEGFEIDLAHAIARRVFGDGYEPAMVKLVPLVPSEKVIFVADEQVDMTISATSMTCGRWEDVDFSAEYFTAHQRFLVRTDSEINAPADLDGAMVCVTANSSSVGLLAKLAPGAVQLPVESRQDCLMALQRGDADAYFGHDSFQFGMLLQDPDNLEIRPIFDDAETVSHYGIVINQDQAEFVRFVNRVLAEEMQPGGVWETSAQRWLVDGLGMDSPVPPPPDYRRADGQP